MKNIKLNYLKVKINNLTDEARDIRRYEIKADRTLQEMKIRKRLSEGNLSDAAVDRLARRAIKVNYRKSGFDFCSYPEVKPNDRTPTPIWKTSADVGEIGKDAPYHDWMKYQHQLKCELKDHRRTIVRNEARAALLAYAFLRGKRYIDTEQPDKHESHPYTSMPARQLWKRVLELAIGFAPKDIPDQAIDTAFLEWKKEAMEYFNRA
jgi:hypothetical protein